MSSLPLLCALGRHRTDPLAQWNDGYYFARCKRCGHDLVRTAFGDWTIPRGYRVVWAAHQPEAEAASLVRDGNGTVRAKAIQARPLHAGERPVEFPIRDADLVAPKRDAMPDDLERRPERREEAMSAETVAVPSLAGAEPPVTDAIREPDPAPAATPPCTNEMRGGTQAMFCDRRADAGVTGDRSGPGVVPSRRHDDAGPPSIHADLALEPPPVVNGYDRMPAFLFPARPSDGAASYAHALMDDEDDRDDDDQDDVGQYDADRDDNGPDEEPDEELVDQDDLFAEAPAPAEPQAPRYLVIPDFMDGGPVEVPYDLRTGELLTDRPSPPSRPAEPMRNEVLDEDRRDGAPGPTWRDAIRDRAQAVAGSGLNFMRSRRPASNPGSIDSLASITASLSVPPATTPVRAPDRLAPPSMSKPASPRNDVAQPADALPSVTKELHSGSVAAVSPVVKRGAAPLLGEASDVGIGGTGTTKADDPAAQAFAQFDPAALRRGQPPRSKSFLRRHSGIAAAAVFGGFVLAAALVQNSPDRTARLMSRLQTPVAETPAAERAVRAPQAKVAMSRPVPVSVGPRATATRVPSGDRAFVTASLLNCRSIPSDDGDTVRRLTRGAAVTVLGADPGWVSVSHQGRQCWASAQFISTTRPL